jgi:hypothetical protein
LANQKAVDLLSHICAPKSLIHLFASSVSYPFLYQSATMLANVVAAGPGIALFETQAFRK